MDELTVKRRKIIATYIAWAFVNLIIWLMNPGDPEDLFPFESHSTVRDYDISEFLIYVIGPFVGYFVHKIFTGK